MNFSPPDQAKNYQMHIKAIYTYKLKHVFKNHIQKHYPDNRGFPWHAKNGEKIKTSEDVVSNPVEHDSM